MNTKFKKKDYKEEKCYIINIKIHSEETNKQSLYSSTFNQIFNLKDFSVKIGNKHALELKKNDILELTKDELGSEFKKLEYSHYEIFSGEFVKYKIEDENDKHYNTVSKEIKSGDPNSIEKPNAIQIPFYFVPSIHRLFLPLRANLNPEKVKLFFEKALLEIYSSEEFYNIDIAKSNEVIERIYKFKTLNKLEISIGYTNDDLGNDAKQFMDSLLKESKINRLNAVYFPEKKESLNMDSKLVKGGIELSKENGEVKATGTNSFGNKVIVNTKNKFEEFPLMIKNGFNPLISIIKETLIKWRI